MSLHVRFVVDKPIALSAEMLQCVEHLEIKRENDKVVYNLDTFKDTDIKTSEKLIEQIDEARIEAGARFISAYGRLYGYGRLDEVVLHYDVDTKEAYLCSEMVC